MRRFSQRYLFLLLTGCDSAREAQQCLACHSTMMKHLCSSISYGGAASLAELRSMFWADPQKYMVIVDQNPLQNFKVLYGIGALKLNDKTGRPEQVGGVKYTIKDGIVYDAKQLLADVAAMVEKQKRAPRTSPAQQ